MEGVTDACSVSLPPFNKASSDRSKVTSLTGLMFFFTVTFTTFFAPPSADFTVILAFPTFFAVSLPFLLTFTIFGLLDLNVSFLLTPLFGVISYLRLILFPFCIIMEEAVWITSTPFFTVTVHFAFTFLFALDVTVMVAFPSAIPETFPFAFTVATFLLLDLYVTALEAPLGLTDFTFSEKFFPTHKVFFVADNVIFVGLAAACTSIGTVKILVQVNTTASSSAIILGIVFLSISPFLLFIF